MSRQPRTAPPKAKFKRTCPTCLAELTIRVRNGQLVIQCPRCEEES